MTGEAVEPWVTAPGGEHGEHEGRRQSRKPPPLEERLRLQVGVERAKQTGADSADTGTDQSQDTHPEGNDFLEEVGPQIAGGQWGSDENLEEAVLAVFKWGLTVMRRAIEGTKWKGEKLFFLKISELWDRGRLKIQWGKKSRIYGTKDMIRAFPLNEIHFHHHIYVAHH